MTHDFRSSWPDPLSLLAASHAARVPSIPLETTAERLLATRLAERQGHARSRALTFDALAAWYLDDYAVRRLRTLNTARGRVANLRAVFTGWRGTGCARTWRGRRRARRRASDDGRAADQRAAVGDRACGGDPAPQFGGRGPSPACRAPSRPPRPALPAAIRAAQAVPGYRRDSEGSRARHVVDTPPALCGPRHVAAPASGDRHRRAVESLGGPDRGAPVLAPLARRARAGRGPHLFPSAAGRNTRLRTYLTPVSTEPFSQPFTGAQNSARNG